MSGQTQRESDRDKFVWKNLAAEYRNFDEIKPRILNKNGQSIFLSRLYPLYQVHLERFNEAAEIWEPGAMGIVCGTVEKPNEPFEIGADREFPVEVDWELSTDDFKEPKWFVIKDHDNKRPLIGKYRLVLRYSRTPWTLFQHPRETFVMSSDEFELRP
jgi:hypothetical protein